MKKQRGISFWGFVWAAAFLICVTVVAVRSIPPYLNNEKINKVLQLLVEERNIMTTSRARILKRMKLRLNIDYADNYVNLDKAFQIKNVKGVRVMTVNYEVVVHLVHNAFLLFDFKNKVEIANNPNGQ